MFMVLWLRFSTSTAVGRVGRGREKEDKGLLVFSWQLQVLQVQVRLARGKKFDAFITYLSCGSEFRFELEFNPFIVFRM